MLTEYQTVKSISGPLLLVESVRDARYGEIVEIEIGDGSIRHGQILQADRDKALIQVFEGTEGIDVNRATIRLLGKPQQFAVSPDILGRVFNGIGNPKDGGAGIIAEKRLHINRNQL